MVIVGWTGPEETGGRADRGGGRSVSAAQRHCGRALQETRPQKYPEEEAGGGETVGHSERIHCNAPEERLFSST